MNGSAYTPLPPGTRAKFYAGLELTLDIAYILRAQAPSWDLETLLISITISEASMRKFVIGPQARRDLLDHPAPPDDVRGTISRRLLADRTGLSRETVRRKVNELIKAGIVVETENGELRPIPNLASSAMQTVATQILDAVRRYDQRLRALGSEGVEATKA